MQEGIYLEYVYRLSGKEAAERMEALIEIVKTPEGITDAWTLIFDRGPMVKDIPVLMYLQTQQLNGCEPQELLGLIQLEKTIEDMGLLLE